MQEPRLRLHNFAERSFEPESTKASSDDNAAQRTELV
jgi:hypothetical protein